MANRFAMPKLETGADLLPSNGTLPILIDTDPGIDDAQAIFYALAHPRLDPIGLTTVFGNVSVADATRNALQILEIAGSDIPVACGASGPLDGSGGNFAHFVHGDDGLGNINLPAPTRRADPLSAAQFIINAANEYSGELVLVPVGPMTNIAIATLLDPELPKKVKAVVLMGGVVAHSGNVSPTAEANFYNDPIAADILVKSGYNLTLVGLDVTHTPLMTRERLDDIAAVCPNTGGFLRRCSEFYIQFYNEFVGRDGCFVHDSSALIYLTRPELFKIFRAEACVTTHGPHAGQVLMNFDSERNYPHDPFSGRMPVSACMTVEGDALLEDYSNTLKSGFANI